MAAGVRNFPIQFLLLECAADDGGILSGAYIIQTMEEEEEKEKRKEKKRGEGSRNSGPSEFWADLVLGRLGFGPSWFWADLVWAELVLGRVDSRAMIARIFRVT